MSRWRSAAELAGALRRAPVIDRALALAAFAALLLDAAENGDGAGVGAAAVALSLATVLPLAVRRERPLAVLAFTTAGLLACLAVFHPTRAAVVIEMVAVYTVGLQGRRRLSLLVGAAMAPVVTVGVLVTSTTHVEAPQTLARLALLLAALAVGDARRGRQALLRAAAQETARQREAHAVHRFDEERIRLAQELHDTVAHTLVGINVRAAAALHLRRRRPSEGFEALAEIERSSADALAELRSTVKLLRSATEAAPMRPPQSLSDLRELIDGVGNAGVEIDLQLDAPRAVPSATAHGAYRIVQESLTNVLRHSRAQRALVRVLLAGDVLTVEVSDDGTGAPGDSSTPGEGLRGMTERAAALGGRCEAGALAGGGWRVRATLPASAS